MEFRPVPRHNAEPVCFGEMETPMKLSRIITFAMALAAAGSAGAAGIGVRAGTNGIGADFGWGIAPTLSGRIGYSWLDNFSVDVETSDVNYSGSLKISSVSGLLDWSIAGPFRITAGITSGDSKIDVTGVPTNPAASAAGSLSGTIKPGKKTAPYLGIGYGNVAGKGVNFYFDIGVVFQGSPTSTLTATCTSPGTAQCTSLQSSVASEQAALNDKISKYQYYPVVSLGITIGF
jgi:hypothetical protein